MPNTVYDSIDPTYSTRCYNPRVDLTFLYTVNVANAFHITRSTPQVLL